MEKPSIFDVKIEESVVMEIKTGEMDRTAWIPAMKVTCGLRAGSQPQEMGFKQTRMDLNETGT